MKKQSKSSLKPGSAFVIMPFHDLTNDQQIHFNEVYESALLPILSEFGYTVVKAESLASSTGNAQIKQRLLQDDLVIVNLTNLSPNIFSKLSIREKTKNNKIILVVDERFEPNPRYDTSRYPCIRYVDRQDKIKLFKGDLATVLSRIKDVSNDNVTVELSIAPEKPTKLNVKVNAEEELSKAIIDTYNDRTPSRIIKKAEDAVSKTPPDIDIFLVDCVQEFLKLDSFTPTDKHFLQMEYLVKKMDLDGISFALLEKAQNLYPESKIVEFRYINRCAQSTQRIYRDHAKQIVFKKYKISVHKNGAEVKGTLTEPHDLYLVSMMLDAMHRNQEIEENSDALAITETLQKQYPQNSIIMRNYARALEYSHRVSRQEFLKRYQQAIFCADVDSLSTKWYAWTLKDAGMLVDVVEVMAFACMLNIDDAENFASLAKEMSNVIEPTNAFIVKKLSRKIPEACNKENVVHATILSENCENFTKQERDICSQALRNVGFDIEDRRDLYTRTYQLGDVSRPERSNFVRKLYESLKSATTDETLYGSQ